MRSSPFRDDLNTNLIEPASPMVDAIAAPEIINMGRHGVAPTSAQRLQANRVSVARLLNSCFWASLAHEEGRIVSSGITFASPEDVLDQFAFANPVPLTLDSLIRLGTIAGTSHKLAVHEHDGEPHIWGF